MRAVELSGPSEFAVVDRSEPEARPGRAVVAMERAGICGTDLHILDGSVPARYPRIPGHELVGTVADSADAARFPQGTRVLIDPAVSCGMCRLCYRSQEQLCRNGGLMGREVDGVFAELVDVDVRNLLEVPETVSEDGAGLLQVLGTVIHTQRSFEVFPGMTGAIIGMGVSGLLHLQMLLLRGVTRVVGITRSQAKLDLATRLGAVATARPDEAEAAVQEVSGGHGADIVIESAGKESTLAQAIELAGFGGHVALFGTLPPGSGENRGIPYFELYFKEITMTAPRAARHDDYQAAIDVVADGRLEVEPIVTARFPLERFADAVAATEDPAQLKVLIHP
jgi:2-desacetyl-2-hydroxyethyl bacteriochlorophyllide A dehydrogenase